MVGLLAAMPILVAVDAARYLLWRRCCSWRRSGPRCGCLAESVVVRLLAAVWPSAVLLVAVRPLELDEVIPVGVVAVLTLYQAGLYLAYYIFL